MTTTTGIRCGSCHGRHPSVAGVRRCYEDTAREQAQAKAEAEAERRNEEFFESGTDMDRMRSIDESDHERYLETQMIQQREREDDERAYAAKAARDEEMDAKARLDAMTGSHGRDMASHKQVRYAMDLLREKEWPDELSKSDIRNMERRQATKLINSLLAAPTKSRDQSPIPEVPAGRYALYTPGEDPVAYSYVDRQDLVPMKKGHWVFYQVDRPEEGKWAGRTFVKQLIGAPGEYRKEPVRGMRAARILTAIAADPEKASLDYGQQSGVCGVCHSPLTNEDSLARGIGPVCASKTGWGA